ncbi:MAG: ribonuclease P protein component [Chloroflexi bacterium]|nr:ribonuclease P protein component [Chloroflexota bacterium]
MLAHPHRLKTPQQFETVRQTGKQWRGELLALAAVANQLDLSRFGIVVSKRVDQRAVVRNRVRRRIRAALAALLPSVSPGYDVVVIAYAAAAPASYHELELGLKRLIRKARIFTEMVE